MTGNRRELPRSSVAGHRLVPHRGFEGSPCGWTHPLLQAERLIEEWSGAPERLVGRDRPDEAGELAGAGDDDLLLWLAACGHPLRWWRRCWQRQARSTTAASCPRWRR